MSTDARVNVYHRDDKLFIRAFLLDSSQNMNNWGVTSDALARDLQTFIGKPYVVTSDFRHPDEAVQERFRKGTITDVGIDQKSGKAYADIEITDKATVEMIKSGELRFVSPSIGVDNPDEEVEYTATGQVAKRTIHKFVGYHIAGVKEPAFGVFKAQIKGQCSGPAHECKKQLMNVQACLQCGTFTSADVVSDTSLRNQNADSSHKMTDSITHKAESCGEGEEWSISEHKCVPKKSASVNASIEEMKAKYDKQISTLTSQLEAEIKRPVIERILTAKVELGKIKAEEKATEAERLGKQDNGALTFIAAELEDAVKAKKEAVAMTPSSVNYRFHRADKDNKDVLGDKEVLKLREGFN